MQSERLHRSLRFKFSSVIAGAINLITFRLGIVQIEAAYKTPPNKACTGQVGFCGIFEQFPGFEFFLLLGRVHAHPPASNANRWSAQRQHLCSRPQCRNKYIVQPKGDRSWIKLQEKVQK